MDEVDAGVSIADLPRLDWEPIGIGGKVRITARDDATGDVVDIDTLDVSRAADRIAYARRGAGLFKTWDTGDFQRALLSIAEERLQPATEPERTVTLTDALVEWASTPDVPRVETGFRPIDELLGGGIPHASINVLAGLPGTGKSALALQVALGALLADTRLLAVWGLGEMSAEALARRAVAVGSALLGEKPVTMTQAGRRSNDAKAVAAMLRHDLGERLTIVSPLTLDRLEMALAETQARLCVVDYLQLCGSGVAADRRQEVDAVVRGLRQLSLTHGVAIVAVSNISRAVGPGSRIGAIGKESGEIDFAADTLLLGEASPEADENGLTGVKWRCLKNRHGKLSDIETLFDGGLQLFTRPEAQPWDEFGKFAPGEDDE